MAELRKRGVITAVVCSGPFLQLGKTQARTFGVPELPLVEILHPLGGISVERVQERADAAVAQLVRLIEEHLK